MARMDPYLNYNFWIELDGIVQGGFTECTGIGSTVEPVEYREGGDAANVRKLLGRTSYNDIQLKWGITTSRELYDWHASVLSGLADRRSGSIILRDRLGEEKVRWNFFEAWPTKWEGPGFNATANEVALDSITLTCERIERA